MKRIESVIHIEKLLNIGVALAHTPTSSYYTWKLKFAFASNLSLWLVETRWKQGEILMSLPWDIYRRIFCRVRGCLEQTHLHIITRMFYSHLASHLSRCFRYCSGCVIKPVCCLLLSYFVPSFFFSSVYVSLILKGYFKLCLQYPCVPCTRCSNSVFFFCNIQTVAWRHSKNNIHLLNIVQTKLSIGSIVVIIKLTNFDQWDS